MEVNFLHLVRSDSVMKITAFWCVMPCSLAERYQCCKRHFLPPSGYEMKAAGSYVTIPLCQTTQHHITQGNHFHASFLLTPIPVGSQKRMCRGHKCSLIRHHLEWHPVTAACKNTVHYFQLFMAVVLKMMVTWTKLSHSEDGDSVSLKWQLCCIKTRRLQSSEQPANIKHYL
jgi:hypothetical protein